MCISFPLRYPFEAFNALVRRCDAVSGEEHCVDGCGEAKCGGDNCRLVEMVSAWAS